MPTYPFRNPPSLEVKRRAEAVVRKLQETRAKGPWTVSGEALRDVRAVEVLEFNPDYAESVLKSAFFVLPN